MKILSVITFVLLVLLSGCSSKSYFSPKKVDSTLSYKLDLKTPLYDVSRDGVTYIDGRVVTRDRGMLDNSIPKGYRFVFDARNAILIADEKGNVKVISGKKVLFEKSFDTALSSGAIKGNLAAFVFSNNKLVLFDLSKNKIIYKEELEPSFALDSRVANPIFLNDLVIFPTLDGRLLVMDKNRRIILRDVALSNKELFNNVIFLKEQNNTIVAATAYKIIVIDPSSIYTKRVDIKDIIFDDNYIYIFTKSGKIIKSDLTLKTIKEKKFDFAMFSAVAKKDKIYAIEKNGYVIELDKNLENVKVLKLPTEIDKPVFAFKNKLFIDHYFSELN